MSKSNTKLKTGTKILPISLPKAMADKADMAAKHKYMNRSEYFRSLIIRDLYQSEDWHMQKVLGATGLKSVQNNLAHLSLTELFAGINPHSSEQDVGDQFFGRSQGGEIL